MLLQQTSKYLMKSIGKKVRSKVLDLSFVHEKVETNLEEMEDEMRDLKKLDIIVKDILRTRYVLAVDKVKELNKRY